MKKFLSLVVVLFITTFSFAQNTVTFEVDMQPAVDSGLFTVGTDTVFLTGSMLGWSEPGTGSSVTLTDGNSDMIYSIVLDSVASGEIQFKFFLNSGWGNGEWPGDPNRVATIGGATIISCVWGFVDSINVAGIRDVKNINVTVYPNPASDFITISLKEGNAQLIDLSGKILSNQDLSLTNTIDVSKLNSGIYFVKIQNEEGTTTEKIVIK